MGDRFEALQLFRIHPFIHAGVFVGLRRQRWMGKKRNGVEVWCLPVYLSVCVRVSLCLCLCLSMSLPLAHSLSTPFFFFCSSVSPLATLIFFAPLSSCESPVASSYSFFAFLVLLPGTKFSFHANSPDSFI